MSESFVIRQPAGQRTLALREAYLATCERDACEAHLLNALERWYAYKLREREQNRGKNRSARQGNAPADADEGLWVRMNAEGWVAELLGLYNEKTIRTKLSKLVERGFVETRGNPTRRWDRTPQWLFKRLAVQDAVDLWEAQRPQPDLDPTTSDAEATDAVPAQSDEASDTTQADVRVQSDKVPNGVGQSSASIRTNVRSNNTGISTQGSFPDTLNRGVSNVTYNPRDTLAEQDTPAAQAETQESQDVEVLRSSSEDASLETAGAPDQELETEALLEGPAATPTADAAPDLALTDTDLDELFGAGDVDDKAPEQVAPGAAAALAAPSVAALRPVPREDLLAREVAVVNSEEYRAIKVLFGKFKLEEMLGELTMTGGFSREDWLRLSLSEIAQAREAAKSEAQSAGGSMVTFAARALDRLIGAVSTQKTPQQAAQQLGAAYVMRSKVEPEPEAPSQGKYEPGALYRPKAGGPEVELMTLEAVKSKIAGAGARYRLSDGQVVPMLELISKFDFVGRVDVSV